MNPIIDAINEAAAGDAHLTGVLINNRAHPTGVVLFFADGSRSEVSIESSINEFVAHWRQAVRYVERVGAIKPLAPLEDEPDVEGD